MAHYTVYINAIVLLNIWSSLQFYGMIILVKTKPLCRGMAWLPFQKDGKKTILLKIQSHFDLVTNKLVMRNECSPWC